jgi:hypothetical protein
MDLNDYWQENKRFVLMVAAGAAVFLLGEALLGSFLGSELQAKRGEIRRTQTELGKSRFGPSQLATARSENEDLAAVVARLGEAVRFEPRPEFVLDPARGTTGNQYFAQVQRVRERLLSAAARENVRIRQDLGLPALAPTRDEELERNLEALDLVERVATFAIEAGVPRVEDIEIRLDPTLFARKQTGTIERTRIKMKLIGPSAPLARLLVMTQDPALGQPLLIDSLTMTPERTKADQADLEVVFAIVRLRGGEPEGEEA